jgi:hypothetical protein
VPRFFFHLYDDGIVLDQEGQELPDIEAAREKALGQARDMICAEVQLGHLSLRHRIEIEDERSRVLLTVQFRDAVIIET